MLAENSKVSNLRGDEDRATNKLVLNAGRGLVEKLRYEGVGKPLGLGAVIVSLPCLPSHNV